MRVGRAAHEGPRGWGAQEKVREVGRPRESLGQEQGFALCSGGSGHPRASELGKK